jgi:hypothetical protein
MADPTDIRRPKTISFTIDGRPYVTADDKQSARDLLQLAGLDPSGYDLAELRGGSPKPKRFEDDEIVHIKDGAKFISIRQRAEVA